MDLQDNDHGFGGGISPNNSTSDLIVKDYHSGDTCFWNGQFYGLFNILYHFTKQSNATPNIEINTNFPSNATCTYVINKFDDKVVVATFNTNTKSTLNYTFYKCFQELTDESRQWLIDFIGYIKQFDKEKSAIIRLEGTFAFAMKLIELLKKISKEDLKSLRKHLFVENEALWCTSIDYFLFILCYYLVLAGNRYRDFVDYTLSIKAKLPVVIMQLYSPHSVKQTHATLNSIYTIVLQDLHKQLKAHNLIEIEDRICDSIITNNNEIDDQSSDEYHENESNSESIELIDHDTTQDVFRDLQSQFVSAPFQAKLKKHITPRMRWTISKLYELSTFTSNTKCDHCTFVFSFKAHPPLEQIQKSNQSSIKQITSHKRSRNGNIKPHHNNNGFHQTKLNTKNKSIFIIKQHKLLQKQRNASSNNGINMNNNDNNGINMNNNGINMNNNEINMNNNEINMNNNGININNNDNKEISPSYIRCPRSGVNSDNGFRWDDLPTPDLQSVMWVLNNHITDEAKLTDIPEIIFDTTPSWSTPQYAEYEKDNKPKIRFRSASYDDRVMLFKELLKNLDENDTKVFIQAIVTLWRESLKGSVLLTRINIATIMPLLVIFAIIPPSEWSRFKSELITRGGMMAIESPELQIFAYFLFMVLDNLTETSSMLLIYNGYTYFRNETQTRASLPSESIAWSNMHSKLSVNHYSDWFEIFCKPIDYGYTIQNIMNSTPSYRELVHQCKSGAVNIIRLIDHAKHTAHFELFALRTIYHKNGRTRNILYNDRYKRMYTYGNIIKTTRPTLPLVRHCILKSCGPPYLYDKIYLDDDSKDDQLQLLQNNTNRTYSKYTSYSTIKLPSNNIQNNGQNVSSTLIRNGSVLTKVEELQISQIIFDHLSKLSTFFDKIYELDGFESNNNDTYYLDLQQYCHNKCTQNTGNINFGPSIQNTGNFNLGPSIQNTGNINLGPSIQNTGNINFGPSTQNTGNFGPLTQNTGNINFGPLTQNTGNIGPSTQNTGNITLTKPKSKKRTKKKYKTSFITNISVSNDNINNFTPSISAYSPGNISSFHNLNDRRSMDSVHSNFSDDCSVVNELSSAFDKNINNVSREFGNENNILGGIGVQDMENNGNSDLQVLIQEAVEKLNSINHYLATQNDILGGVGAQDNDNNNNNNLLIGALQRSVQNEQNNNNNNNNDITTLIKDKLYQIQRQNSETALKKTELSNEIEIFDYLMEGTSLREIESNAEIGLKHYLKLKDSYAKYTAPFYQNVQNDKTIGNELMKDDPLITDLCEFGKSIPGSKDIKQNKEIYVYVKPVMNIDRDQTVDELKQIFEDYIPPTNIKNLNLLPKTSTCNLTLQILRTNEYDDDFWYFVLGVIAKYTHSKNSVKVFNSVFDIVTSAECYADLGVSAQQINSFQTNRLGGFNNK